MKKYTLGYDLDGPWLPIGCQILLKNLQIDRSRSSDGIVGPSGA